MFRLASLVCILSCFLVACATRGSGVVGGACTKAADCKSGLVCVTDLPGGICTADCSATACADGQVCASIGGAQLCIPTCTTRADCRSDYQCFNGVCTTPCADATTDCAPRGFTCEAGQCTELPGVANGGKCSIDDDCSSQLCLLGTCRQACNSEALCPVAETCAINAIGDNGELNPTTQIRPACIPRRDGVAPNSPCMTDDDCDQGTCQFQRCVNLCNSESQCGASGTCSTLAIYLDSGVFPNVDVCLPAPSLIQFDGSFGFASVPSTARSLALFATLTKTTNYEDGAGIISLTEPDGTEVYTAPQTEADYLAALIRYLPTEISSTMLIPNSPAYTLKQGMYTFQSGTFLGGASKTTGYLKISKEPITTGSVPLNFYVTDLSGGACTRARVTEADGASKLATAIQEIKDIYDKAGVTVGPVTFQTSTATNTINSDDPSELGKVLEAGTKGHDTTIGMDIVLIRSIGSNNNPGLVTLGIAGGIPSAPVLGNPHSGVVVAMDAICDYGQDWPYVLASTIAHEAGHSFGLFHNVEQDGTKDQMTDNNADGASSLMYWLEYGGSKISAQQATVLRHDPKVKQ